MSEHIVSAFDDDLTRIQGKISEMGGLVEESLKLALEAVKNRDPEMAQKVIVIDKRVDELDEEIEAMATNVIALRQPMAVDLRTLIAALKVSTTLERIGDLAKNISKRAVHLSQGRKIKLSRSVVKMGELTQRQLTQILDAYTERNAGLAVAIWKNDIEIDDTYNAIFRELVTYMASDSRMIGLGSQLLFIAKNLERIGDHTTHISELIYYIVNGERLGDERPKGEPLGLEAMFEEDDD